MQGCEHLVEKSARGGGRNARCLLLAVDVVVQGLVVPLAREDAKRSVRSREERRFGDSV